MVPENLNYTTVTSKINGIEVDCLLHIGNSGSCMSEDTAKSIKVKVLGVNFKSLL